MTTAAAPPEAHQAPAREVRVDLLALHAKVLRRMPVVQTLLVAGMALFMHPYVSAALYLGWCVLTVGMEVIRAVYAARMLRRGYAVEPGRTHGRLVALAAAAGSTAGLGAVLLLPRLPILDQALFGIILFAMPAAGVAVSQSSRWIVSAYALTILLPAAGTWIWLHPSHDVAVALLTLLYCGLIATAAADADRLLLRSVMVRHQRDRLVADLEERNAAVGAAMQRAEQAAAARARVLAAASHDLRQPLHALSLYSAVLAAQPAPEVLHEVGSNIDLIVRSLGSLLHGLLDLSHLSTGQYRGDRQPFALDQAVASVCTEYELGAQAKGLSLHTDLAPITLMGDALAVSRITRNLLDNAVKYCDCGGITVHTRLDTSSTPPLAILSVADTGRGIAEGELGRIFEEFYQVDNPGRDRSQGVGLGLTIVQRLCELIGAAVQVQSQPGQGTCFTVSLPATGPTPPKAPAAPPIQPHDDLRGRRVLVVDDEADILAGMSRLLELWGMVAHTAAGAAQAEALCAAHGPPDVAVVDLRLGSGEHGADLAARLQARWGPFAVLIVTGEMGTPALQAAQARGFAVLHKPIAAELLRHAVAGLLPGVR